MPAPAISASAREPGMTNLTLSPGIGSAGSRRSKPENSSPSTAAIAFQMSGGWSTRRHASRHQALERNPIPTGRGPNEAIVRGLASEWQTCPRGRPSCERNFNSPAGPAHKATAFFMNARQQNVGSRDGNSGTPDGSVSLASRVISLSLQRPRGKARVLPS
jgi:hypothetical protein